MVSLIIGKKGSGKTKRMVTLADEAVANSKGNVVVVEKGPNLMYDLTYKARLINAEEYNISGYEALYGFISGMCAGNFDITDIFVDATLRIGGRDYGALTAFVEKLSEMDVNIIVTVSCDEDELPADIFKYAKKV